jgi:hypothetical protein
MKQSAGRSTPILFFSRGSLSGSLAEATSLVNEWGVQKAGFGDPFTF